MPPVCGGGERGRWVRACDEGRGAPVERGALSSTASVLPLVTHQRYDDAAQCDPLRDATFAQAPHTYRSRLTADRRYPDGHELTERQPVSRQLTEPSNAQIVANYSDSAFVLGGWMPVVDSE
jgi:hypothetical protein